MNNEIVKKFENMMLPFQQTNQPLYQNTARALGAQLVLYAQFLRRNHDELKGFVDELLPLVRKAIED